MLALRLHAIPNFRDAIRNQSSLFCLLILFTILLQSSASFAQEKKIGEPLKMVPPTPAAAKMTEYFSQKPNMYTGTASVSIPLYTIDFDGWKLPLSLSYNASGVRPNEEAGEVGLGWALNATGIISRTINDGDDFYLGGLNGKKRGYVYGERPVQFDLGFTSKAWDDTPPPLSYYTYIADTNPDTQPDVFSYNFFGYSGSFVLTQKILRDTIKVVKLSADATKIIFHEPTQTFTVITPEGFKGEFTVKERSSSFTSSAITVNRFDCCNQNFIDDTHFENNSGRLRTVTSWYLSKITSPRRQTISFNYDMENNSSSHISNSRSFAEYPDKITLRPLGEVLPTCQQVVHEHVYLKDIVSADAGIQLNFGMETREDLRRNELFTPAAGGRIFFKSSSGLMRYKNIVVNGLSPGSTLHKAITFTQRYFNQQYRNENDITQEELVHMRSRLDAVQIDDQKYYFFYELGLNGTGLPSKVTTGIDHFGFYNGQSNEYLMAPEIIGGEDECQLADTLGAAAGVKYFKALNGRRVEFDYGKAGLLKKIKYPTRGYTVFEYEPHEYYPDTTQAFREQITSVNHGNKAGGARIKAIREYDYNDSLVRSKEYQYKLNPKTSNVTSGRLMTPLYNRFIHIWYGNDFQADTPPQGCGFLYRRSTSIPGNNAAEGKVIGYSRVDEIVKGKTDQYVNTYYFENEPSKVIGWNAVALGQNELNGKLKESRNFNSDGHLVEQLLNQNYEHYIDSVKSVVYEDFEDSQETGPARWIYYAYGYYIKGTFHTPYMTVTTTPLGSIPTTENANGVITWGPKVEVKKEFGFNKRFQLNYEKTLDSKGDLSQINYFRPADYVSFEINSPLSFMMRDTVNIVDPVIETRVFKNGTMLSINANLFGLDNVNKIVNLKSTYRYINGMGASLFDTQGTKFRAPFERIDTFLRYDAKGKLLEYLGSDGIRHSFIWKDNLPVVHATGVSYQNLETAYNATSANQNYESLVRSDANISGAQLSTYVHDPLVGITKITDANGKKQTFEYDQYGKLFKVRDNDSNVLEQHEYKFRSGTGGKLKVTSTKTLNFGNVYSCTKERVKEKTVTIVNEGEDDLTIQKSNLFGTGYSSEWVTSEVTLAPEEHFEFTVKFIAGAAGTYSRYLILTDTAHSKADTITLLGNVITEGTLRTLTVTPKYTTSEGYTAQQKIVTIKNTGNACKLLTGLRKPNTFDWSVQMIDHEAKWDTLEIWDLNQPLIGHTVWLSPGDSLQLDIRRTSGSIADTDDNINLLLENGHGMQPDTIRLRNPARILNVDSKDKEIRDFKTAFAPRSLTIRNPGNSKLTVANVTSTSGYFSFVIKTFQVQPGGYYELPVMFDPPEGVTNFDEFSTTINIYGDQTNPTSGIQTTFIMKGQRALDKRVTLSLSPISQAPGPAYIEGNNYISIYIKNPGNVPVMLTGIEFGFANNPDFEADSDCWRAEFDNDFGNGVLSENNADLKTIKVRLYQPALLESQRIRVKFKWLGDQIVMGSEDMTLHGRTRKLFLSSTNFSFTDFIADTVSLPLTVRNDGNTALDIYSVVSSDPKFTLTVPLPSSLAPGGVHRTRVKFSPTSFSAVSNQTITFNTNDDDYQSRSIQVSGQRKEQRTISVTPGPVYLHARDWMEIPVMNTGNTPLTITGFSYYYVGSATAYGPIEFTANLPNPSTIAKGGIGYINVSALKDVPAPQKIRILYNKTGTPGASDEVEVRPQNAILDLSTLNIVIPEFINPATATYDFVVSNAQGSATLNVSLSETHDKFSLSHTSLSIPAGQQQIVTVTFNPGAYNFEPYSTSIHVTGNQVNIQSANISVSAQRKRVRRIQLSNTNLVFEYTNVPQFVYVTNNGNDLINVTGLSFGSSLYWYVDMFPASGILSPGGLLTIEIRRKPAGATPDAPPITVVSDAFEGDNVISLTARSRHIELSTATFGSFTCAASTTGSLTVSNYGTEDLAVDDIILNGANPGAAQSYFTVTTNPKAFAIPPNGHSVINFQYQPPVNNFTQNYITVQVMGNSTSGYNYKEISAARTQVYNVGVSTASVFVRPQTNAGIGEAFINNTGNVDATVTITCTNRNQLEVKLFRMDAIGNWLEINPSSVNTNDKVFSNVSLSGCKNLKMTVTNAASVPWNYAAGQIIVDPDQGSTHFINISKNTN